MAHKKVWSLYVLAFILIFGPVFGINDLLNSILNHFFHNPANNTSSRADVNIMLLCFWGLCTMIGIILAVIGLLRSVRNRKVARTH